MLLEIKDLAFQRLVGPHDHARINMTRPDSTSDKVHYVNL